MDNTNYTNIYSIFTQCKNWIVNKLKTKADTLVIDGEYKYVSNGVANLGSLPKVEVDDSISGVFGVNSADSVYTITMSGDAGKHLTMQYTDSTMKVWKVALEENESYVHSAYTIEIDGVVVGSFTGTESEATSNFYRYNSVYNNTFKGLPVNSGINPFDSMTFLGYDENAQVVSSNTIPSYVTVHNDGYWLSGHVFTASTMALGWENRLNLENGNGSNSILQTASNSNVANGSDSLALGGGNSALSTSSIAVGYANKSDEYGFTFGNANTASGWATSVGGGCVASGNGAFAAGHGCSALSSGSTSIGSNCTANGNGAVALGRSSTAHSDSCAEGYITLAVDGGHSEGELTVASGVGAHAEGYYSQALDQNAHAEGFYTKAKGFASHTEGYSAYTTEKYAHAEGDRCSAMTEASHVEGRFCVVSGEAKGAHAEGLSSVAAGHYSHAENNSMALGTGSHAEGTSTAKAYYSHAQGIGCTAEGEKSMVGGENSRASGTCSFAYGSNVLAANDNEFAVGKFNQTSADTIFTVGIGYGATTSEESDRRFNGLAVTTGGNIYIRYKDTDEKLQDLIGVAGVSAQTTAATSGGVAYTEDKTALLKVPYATTESDKVYLNVWNVTSNSWVKLDVDALKV